MNLAEKNSSLVSFSLVTDPFYSWRTRKMNLKEILVERLLDDAWEDRGVMSIIILLFWI